MFRKPWVQSHGPPLGSPEYKVIVCLWEALSTNSWSAFGKPWLQSHSPPLGSPEYKVIVCLWEALSTKSQSTYGKPWVQSHGLPLGSPEYKVMAYPWEALTISVYVQPNKWGLRPYMLPSMTVTANCVRLWASSSKYAHLSSIGSCRFYSNYLYFWYSMKYIKHDMSNVIKTAQPNAIKWAIPKLPLTLHTSAESDDILIGLALWLGQSRDMKQHQES